MKKYNLKNTDIFSWRASFDAEDYCKAAMVADEIRDIIYEHVCGLCDEISEKFGFGFELESVNMNEEIDDEEDSE